MNNQQDNKKDNNDNSFFGGLMDVFNILKDLVVYAAKSAVGLCLFAVAILLVVCIGVGLFGEGDSSDVNAGSSSHVELVQDSQDAESGTKSSLLSAADSDSMAVKPAKRPVLPGVSDRKPYEGDVRKLPNPQRLVNDFACVLTESQIQMLEDTLEAFSRNTSNQITVVTVMDLEGEDPNIFAAELGDKWGVGQKGTDNGVVILFKAKTMFSKGQVAISPGRGLEGALPDAFCKDIVEDKMMPELEESNDYSAATWAALQMIMPVCKGEYSYQQYQDDNEPTLFDWLCVLLMLIPGLFIFFFSDGGSFTSGGGGFGGSSGGGFGGFGGGSFSGGGASGSW